MGRGNTWPGRYRPPLDRAGRPLFDRTEMASRLVREGSRVTPFSGATQALAADRPLGKCPPALPGRAGGVSVAGYGAGAVSIPSGDGSEHLGSPGVVPTRHEGPHQHLTGSDKAADGVVPFDRLDVLVDGHLPDTARTSGE